jgi:HemY protein
VKAYRYTLLLLALALLGGIAAWVIGSDPGYVLIQRGAWAVETSVVFALAAVVAFAVLLALLVWLVRWPLRAMIRRSRRRGRMQFARGMLALAEGRPVRAENLLGAASKLRSLRIPALLGAYRAARQRGDAKKQGEWLARLGAETEADAVAVVLRAEAELEEGRAGTVVELLTPLDQAQTLPPAGAMLLARALSQRGRARETLALLSRVRRSQAMPAADAERFEARVLAAALAQASDAINLQSLWAELNRAQRREPVVAQAYALRAGALGLGEPVANEIENIVRKHYADDLALAWLALPGDKALLLAAGESLLKEHGSRWGLTLGLGTLCRELGLWGKAEDYLRRALGLGAGARGWEELGRCYDAQKDNARAARAYANGLAATRGENPAPLLARGTAEDVLAPLAVAEERNEHGVPRLPEALRKP